MSANCVLIIEYDKALLLFRQALLQTKGATLMAALAIVEVGLAEGALAVVAGHARLGARVGKMLRRNG